MRQQTNFREQFRRGNARSLPDRRAIPSAVVRWAKRKGVPKGSWLGRMLERKPPMLVIVALANKNARIVWALLTKGESYRAPVVPA
ncbi:hypothetical protein X755_33110 [Mesorhizobium sp. LNJC405B00]|nr:hypothetical protein X755_33110 [Mesorhizobium sp. LNJC405B00]